MKPETPMDILLSDLRQKDKHIRALEAALNDAEEVNEDQAARIRELEAELLTQRNKKLYWKARFAKRYRQEKEQ